MKIAIDIRTLMDDRYSGVSEYTLAVVKSLTEADKENEYILFSNSSKDISAKLPVFDSAHVTYRNFRIPNKIFNYALTKPFSYPKLDKLLGVDIFFMPHINFASFLPETKKILTIHDLSFLRHKEFFSLRKNIWHWLLSVPKLARSMDKIIAVSEHTKKDIIELCGVNADRITVIPSGIDPALKPLALNDPESVKVRKKYSLPEKYFLYLGTIEPRKNIEGIIRAFEYFCASGRTGHDLVLAGGLGWKYKPIMKRLNDSEYKDRISYIGYVDKKDKRAIYSLAEIFLYPSFYEGFGFPPLEAMACGTPVISSPQTSLGEILGPAALYCDPDNSRELADLIYVMTEDARLRQSFIRSGIKMAGKYRGEGLGTLYKKAILE